MCGGEVSPVAWEPLWQLAQMVASAAVWAKVAFAQVVVPLWQVEQSAPFVAT
jgi:hypothetical protein